MRWQTLGKGYGDIGVESLLRDGKDIRQEEHLLYGIVENFARFNAFFYVQLGEFQFVYREPQILPIMFASALNAGASPFAEQPIWRGKGKEPKGHGRLDLWILHRDVVFLLEVKRVMLSFYWRSNTKLNAKWTEALRQLEAIRPESIRDLSDEGRWQVFKVAILLVPIYQQSKYKHELKPITKRDLAPLSDELSAALAPEPSWVALWTIPREWQKNPWTYREGLYENYPALFFLTRLESVEM